MHLEEKDVSLSREGLESQSSTWHQLGAVLTLATCLDDALT